MTEKPLTPDERHEIQVAAEFIIAMSALPKSIPIDGRKVKGLAKSVVQYEVALIASEKCREKLEAENERLKDEMESQLDYIGTLEDDIEEAKGG